MMGAVLFLAFVLTAAEALADTTRAAPPIRASTWLNREGATAPDYRGEVTLVEFWTFACWNCKNVEPYVKSWHERFGPRGLRVIAVHTPELPQERVVANVRRYAEDHALPYPIAIDNEFAVWESFGNRAWPTWYLIDRAGRIRYAHEGEGGYAETEAQIEALLTEGR